MTFKEEDLRWASWLLRLTIASVFLGTALIKVKDGIPGTIAYYEVVFEGSVFPPFLFRAHATIIMGLEFVLGIWLLAGFYLRAAWITSALTMLSLAFGLIFAKKFEIVSNNNLYVVVCALGLTLSVYDPLQWSFSKKGRPLE